MGCKDTVLLEPLLRNCIVNCLTFERITRQPHNDNLCLFRALALHLYGNEELEEETSIVFNLFLNNSEKRDPSMFQGVHMTNIPNVEEMLQLNIFLYDIDFVDGKLIGELARRSIQKFEKSVKLLRYNNHNCYVTNINALFKAFRCTTCDIFFSKMGNLEQHLVTCSDRVEHIYPKMFTNWQKRFLKSWMHSTCQIEMTKNCSRSWQYLTLSSFLSRKQTHTNKLRLQRGSGSMCPYQFLSRQTWSRDPFFSATPILIISSRLLSLPDLDGLATQSNAQIKLHFIEKATAIKLKLCAILEQLNQGRNRAERVSIFVDDCIVEEEEKEISTQFLQMQKNQLIDSQEHFRR